MITTDKEKHLFKLFIKHKVDCPELFNEIVSLFSEYKEELIASADAENYEILRRLMSLENNSGWDTQEKHSRKIDIIKEAQDVIVERSEECLP